MQQRLIGPRLDFGQGASRGGGLRFELLKSTPRMVDATQQAAVSLAPFRAELGEVTARAPSGRLVIEEDGRLNFARVLPAGKGGEEGGGAQVTLRRLRIEQGTLDFADRSLDNDFAVPNDHRFDFVVQYNVLKALQKAGAW